MGLLSAEDKAAVTQELRELTERVEKLSHKLGDLYDAGNTNEKLSLVLPAATEVEAAHINLVEATRRWVDKVRN